MAGKHRKVSRNAAVVAAVVAPGGIAAAALAVSGFSPGAATPADTPSQPSVGLAALITPANSTAQIFAGTTYYGKDWTTVYGAQQVVPFFQGPGGIADAIVAHKTDSTPTGVVASGWGAGQTGTALAGMTDAQKSNVAFVILDNNTNRAGGGFWTTYAPFAPLLATSAAPTPSNTGVPTLDVAYEYNINSDAPVDPLNPFALGNSLAAYVYDYGAQSTAVIPNSVMQEAQNTTPGTQHYAYVIDTKGDIVGTPKPVSGTTTYVTIQQDNLPLTRPLRLIPGGDILANAIDPTMTQLVDAGYNDGKGMPNDPAIPADPTVTRPMQPGSSLTGLGGVPGSIPEGATDGAQTAIQDVSNPTNFVTKPLGEAGELPLISSLPSLSSASLPNSSVATATAGSPNFFAPVIPGAGNKSSSGGSSATGANVVNNFTDQVKKAVDKVTGGLTGAKPAGSTSGTP